MRQRILVLLMARDHPATALADLVVAQMPLPGTAAAVFHISDSQGALLESASNFTVGKAKLRRGRKHTHPFAAKGGRRLENNDLLVRIEEFKGGRVGSFEHVLASFILGQHRLAGGLV